MLNSLLTIQINNFLFFRYVKIPRSKITSKRNFPQMNIIFSSSFSLTFPTFGMPKSVHAHGNVLV